MEIIVRFVEGAHSKTNVPFWKVEDTSGRHFTVWDKDIADRLSETIGKVIDVEVKISPDGKFSNIRGINVMATATGSETASTPAPSPTLSVGDERSKSIVAQCLVKAVLGANSNAILIDEAVDMYKEALELL